MKRFLVLRYKIWGLLVAGFILAVSVAQFAYVQSTFLNGFFNIETVSLIFFLAFLIDFIVINFYPNLIAKFNNTNCALFVLFLEIISLLIFIFLPVKFWVFVGFIVFVVSRNLIYINFDIFLKAQSKDEDTGEIRGIYMTIMNLGWVLSPFLSGLIIENYGFNWLFGFIIFLILPIIYIILLKYNKFKNHYQGQHFHFFATIKELMKHPNIKKIFYVSFLLQFFYAVMIIYTPIYLNQTVGLPWDKIGIIFTIMLLPFIFIEYPAGYLADKYWGEKEMLTGGIIIIALSLILIFYVNTSSVLLWALLLFLTRVGASLVEIMCDTYFFKKVDRDDITFINAYRSTQPLSYIFAPAIFAGVLLFFSIHYVFLFLAAIMLTGLYFTLTLKDTK